MKKIRDKYHIYVCEFSENVIIRKPRLRNYKYMTNDPRSVFFHGVKLSQVFSFSSFLQVI